MIPVYSVRGWMHLKKDLDNTAKEFNVEILDKTTRPIFYDWGSYEGYTAEEYANLEKGFSTLYEGLI